MPSVTPTTDKDAYHAHLHPQRLQLHAMTKKQRHVFYVLLGFSLVYFCLTAFPNAVGSDDHNMLAVFEPDEFAQYPHVLRMLRGGDTLTEAARRFFVYQHYYYGFPFYFLSAVTIFPLKLINGLSSTTQIMWVLRQFVSVVPMIIAALIFVYLFTRFEHYGLSIGTFIFLLTIPAVFQNSLWWHPDSLTILFIALTFFFLDKDELNFGKEFYFSAVACGFAIGTKLIGLFFFIAIPTYIAWGYFVRGINLKQAFMAAGQFVLIMVAVVLISNPMLLVPEVRETIIKIQQKQSEAMSFGWQVAYAKGPQSWFGVIEEFYGNGYFISLSLLAIVLGLIRGPKRLLNTLILAWTIPFSFYILFFIAIKPTHFFIPIALPLFACVSYFFSHALFRKDANLFANRRKIITIFLFLICLTVVGIQFTSNILWDFDYYFHALEREETSPSIAFFTELEDEYLSRIPGVNDLIIYRDIRVYVPDTSAWNSQYRWGVIDDEYIQEIDPDILLLSRQRARDYTSQGVIETADDPAQMTKTYNFYQNALEHTIPNYQLIYEDDFGLAFLREEIFREHLE